MRRARAPRRLLDRLANQSDQMLQVLVEQASVAMAIVDRDGAIIRVNDSLRRMVDPACDLAPGCPLVAIFAEEFQAHLSAVLAPALQGDPLIRPIGATLRGNAATRSVDVSAVPVRATGQQSTGAVLQLFDVSRQRALETQLAQSQKLQAVGQLAAGIAHDFNNLLTAIIGAADEAMASPVAGAKLMDDLQQIRASADRGADLVRQLLAFSRKQDMQPQVLLLDGAVAKVSGLLGRVLGGQVELALCLGAAGRWVRADPTQFEQVLINLAVNARYAMPGGGTLTLRTGLSTLRQEAGQGPDPIPPGSYVKVEVQDTGVGIANDVLSRIFDPFFTTRRDQGGSGLGLSTVHGIVRQSGGYMEVESEQGRGALFRIYLPHCDAPGPIATPPVCGALPPSIAAPGGRLVLVVDDEAELRHLAARALTRHGWTVLTAESGDAALSLLRAGSLRDLCALICDVVMPGLDGPALVRVLRGWRPELPVILTSGYAEHAASDGAMGGDVNVLPKPYTLQRLLHVVATAALPRPL